MGGQCRGAAEQQPPGYTELHVVLNSLLSLFVPVLSQSSGTILFP